jgi:hypothetical protein
MKHEQNIDHPRIRSTDKIEKYKCCHSFPGFGIQTQQSVELNQEMSIGVTIYFKMLKYLVVMFCWFTFVSIPTFVMYSAGDKDSEVEGVEFKSVVSDLTAGNLGEAKIPCSDSPINKSHHLYCDYGEFTELLSFTRSNINCEGTIEVQSLLEQELDSGRQNSLA